MFCNQYIHEHMKEIFQIYVHEKDSAFTIIHLTEKMLLDATQNVQKSNYTQCWLFKNTYSAMDINETGRDGLVHHREAVIFSQLTSVFTEAKCKNDILSREKTTASYTKINHLKLMNPSHRNNLSKHNSLELCDFNEQIETLHWQMGIY